MKVETIRSAEKTIGGHIALDFLNTVSIVNGETVDAFQSDADVQAWLNDLDIDISKEVPTFTKDSLLQSARKLRESFRETLAESKNGDKVDLTAINQFLAYDISHPQLVTGANNKLILQRHRSVKHPEQLLATVANAAAELLATDNLDLVRRCESSDCVLWFFDRTKGHKRRWCSMAICGNRHKVSSFRKRVNVN